MTTPKILIRDETRHDAAVIAEVTAAGRTERSPSMKDSKQEPVLTNDTHARHAVPYLTGT